MLALENLVLFQTFFFVFDLNFFYPSNANSQQHLWVRARKNLFVQILLQILLQKLVH